MTQPSTIPVEKLSELLPPTQPSAPLGQDKGWRLDTLLKELTRLKAKYGGNIKVCWDFGGSEVEGISERFATKDGIKTHFNPALEPFIELLDSQS